MPRVWLIDQDGVLADFDGEVRRRCLEQFPQMPLIPQENHAHFYFSENYSEPWRSLINTIYTQPGFILALPPIPGGLEAVRALTEIGEGETVCICTSPFGQYQTCGEKFEWIKRYLGPEFIVKTVLAKDKNLVRGDFLIDDRPEITGDLAPMWEHIIFDQPYNRHIVGKRRLTWQNWREVLGI